MYTIKLVEFHTLHKQIGPVKYPLQYASSFVKKLYLVLVKSSDEVLHYSWLDQKVIWLANIWPFTFCKLSDSTVIVNLNDFAKICTLVLVLLLKKIRCEKNTFFIITLWVCMFNFMQDSDIFLHAYFVCICLTDILFSCVSRSSSALQSQWARPPQSSMQRSHPTLPRSVPRRHAAIPRSTVALRWHSTTK